AARRGVDVTLYEMRPAHMTPAHRTGRLAELVCSNSLGSDLVDRAPGLLKQELRRLGSLILACADDTAVPAGSALAVGRQAFAEAVTAAIEGEPRIRLVREHVASVPREGVTVIATGPLTSNPLADDIAEMLGEDYLAFYDAMAPIVMAESVNMDVAFRQSRHDQGDADYINCPMTEAEYDAFVDALVAAETIPLHEFEREDEHFFEACLPVEVLAKRGHKALAYGPLRPIGLRDPRTGRRPYAVVQLRQDNLAGTLYNLVGFQTNLRWGEQRRVFSMIPGLEQAEWVRFGQMHRNTYIDAPSTLEPTLAWRQREDLFFAGQLMGTEGYVGSTMSGLVAGINVARLATDQDPVTPPPTTMAGALLHYVTHATGGRFDPMKPNFGLMPPLAPPVRRKRARYQAYAARAMADLETWIERAGVLDDVDA
ncbi:MAG: methylenetetrahydrofolate--tRNA-(uracil(54)-C(5))-methyltransferase (FADH(2)-oxidizing) TrmFO, partial [Anaerolineae bacterium]